MSTLTDVVMKVMGPIFHQGYNVTCENFSSHLTWYCDSLKSAVSLEQCHNTGSSARVQKEKGAVQNRSLFGLIVKLQSRLHHTTQF